MKHTSKFNAALGMAAVCGWLLLPMTAHARPVSYPGGITVMAQKNDEVTSTHVHYSPTAKYSIGHRFEKHREDNFQLQAAQLNYLVNRWNKPDSQANLYFKTGLGGAYNDNGPGSDLAAFAGIAADWETRKYFASYENRYLEAGKIASSFEQRARVGIAPYVAEYGSIHTWLMLEAKYNEKDEDPFTLTPLVRLFKGPALLEAGVSSSGSALLNFIYRY